MYDQFIDLNLGITTLEAMILQFLEHVIILAILVNLFIHDNKTSKPLTHCALLMPNFKYSFNKFCIQHCLDKHALFMILRIFCNTFWAKTK